MRIAVDYSLAEKHTGGMGVFVKNIIKELKGVDKKNLYTIMKNPIIFQPQNVLTKFTSAVKEHLWYQTKFLTLLKNEKVDLLYSPNPPVPFFFAKPIILTIPDMAFYYEDSIPYLMKRYLLFNYLLAAKKAKIITTFSEYSKRDIQEILKIEAMKISVIPLAASEYFKKNNNNKEVDNTLKKYNISKPFILCTPGTFLPRKNVSDLILAVSNLPSGLRKNIQVVLVGKNQGFYFESVKNYTRERNMNEHVVFTGYVKPESADLINIYTAAKLFVYPSLYEGFGLPPLEAMKIGIPVIVYNKTSLPEVVSNAGEVVNNHQELTRTMTKILNNQKLCNFMIKKGLDRAKVYSWKSSALEFRNLIESYEKDQMGSSLYSERSVVNKAR